MEKKILGWRQYISPIKINDVYRDGPQYLADIEYIEQQFGMNETYSYSSDMMNHENFVVIVKETMMLTIFSIVSIMIVVLFMTGSIFISLLTLFTIIQIDIFLVALMPLWDLTFNNVTLIHLVSSLGLSVLYSVDISMTYLWVEAPFHLSFDQQRTWKSRVALSRASTSVFHASLATLSAILIIGMSNPRSYLFIVFYKLWFGIILVGMLNAFVVIPIILSLIGPTPEMKEKIVQRKVTFFKRVKTMNFDETNAFVRLHSLGLDS